MDQNDTVGDWILRAEGVNFGHTVFHTQNLAVIRGASATLETAMGAAATFLEGCSPAGKLVYSAASQLVWRVEGAAKADVLALAQQLRDWLATPGSAGKPPTQYLTILVDVARIRPEVGKEHLAELYAVNRAQLATRYRQMRSPSFPGFAARDLRGDVDTQFKAICPVDGRRPVGDAPEDCIWVPDQRYAGAVECGARRNGRKRILVSPNVATLMEYGRRRRRMQYREMMPDLAAQLGDADTPNSFEDIIEKPPKGLSVSAKAKMAVFYVDGAGFTKLRDAMAQSRGLKAFADLANDFLSQMVTGVVSKFVSKATPVYRLNSTDDEGEAVSRIRVETLLRAGDEFCIVVPAWTAAELVSDWFRTVERFNDDPGNRALMGQHRLVLRIGCLICSEKTPIRRARDLADLLQTEVKCADTGNGGVLFHILESMEAPEPDQGFTDLRSKLFRDTRPGSFVFPAEQWEATIAQITRLKQTLPRSQLRKLIRRLDDPVNPATSKAARDAIAKGLARSGQPDLSPDDLLCDALNYSAGEREDFSLKLLDDLWDYVDPFGVGATA